MFTSYKKAVVLNHEFYEIIVKGAYIMTTKDYIGCCGSCVNCALNDSYTFLYTTTFKCTQWNRSVKADEKACSKYEVAKNRTNDLIARFDK